MKTQCKACLGNGGWCGNTDCNGLQCGCPDTAWVDCDPCEGSGEIEDPNYTSDMLEMLMQDDDTRAEDQELAAEDYAAMVAEGE